MLPLKRAKPAKADFFLKIPKIRYQVKCYQNLLFWWKQISFQYQVHQILIKNWIYYTDVDSDIFSMWLGQYSTPMFHFAPLNGPLQLCMFVQKCHFTAHSCQNTQRFFFMKMVQIYSKCPPFFKLPPFYKFILDIFYWKWWMSTRGGPRGTFWPAIFWKLQNLKLLWGSNW